eukprot:4338514-Ditylum_brightwellii.AAC.1
MAYAIRDNPSQFGGAEFTPLYHVQDTTMQCPTHRLSYKLPLRGYTISQDDTNQYYKTQPRFCHMWKQGGFHQCKNT